MKNSQLLSADEVRRKVSTLRTEFARNWRAFTKSDARSREIGNELRELQARCPHENTQEELFDAVPELRLKTICTDCGARY